MEQKVETCDVTSKTETISMQELMEILGISSKYAYALVKDPMFPCMFVGSKCIISRKAFYAWWHDPNQLIHFKSSCKVTDDDG